MDCQALMKTLRGKIITVLVVAVIRDSNMHLQPYARVGGSSQNPSTAVEVEAPRNANSVGVIEVDLAHRKFSNIIANRLESTYIDMQDISGVVIDKALFNKANFFL